MSIPERYQETPVEIRAGIKQNHFYGSAFLLPEKEVIHAYQYFPAENTGEISGMKNWIGSPTWRKNRESVILKLKTLLNQQ